jgi:hypothetical protein
MPADPYVPLIVIGVIVIIVFLAGRSRTEDVSDSPEEPPTGADLIEQLQRTLGVAIVVESMESVETSEAPDTISIQAMLMSGTHSTKVTVAGPTASDAWAALAKAAIAWRNSDFQHIPMWWGSG